MNKDYDFDLLVSEEEFKKNKEIERERKIIKSCEKDKKKQDNIITVMLLLFVAMIIFLTIFLSIKKFDMNANMCDNEKGYTCSYYEVLKSVK
jgi:hypothetical protein